jgi:hypothetical protein
MNFLLAAFMTSVCGRDKLTRLSALAIGAFLLAIIPQALNAQTVAPAGNFVARPLCPGGFPTDLSVTNCTYTLAMRWDAFVENSLTDKAILGAVVFGLGAQIVESPGEWKRTWSGYGKRVGVRYNQAVASGTAQFLVGFMMNDDPRHISYRNDPHLHAQRLAAISRKGSGESTPQDPYAEQPHATMGKRIGHAFFDSVTVRRSSMDGNGRRLPALSRFVGAYASAYGGYAWYPGPENTPKQTSHRSGDGEREDLAHSSSVKELRQMWLTSSCSPSSRASAVPTLARCTFNLSNRGCKHLFMLCTARKDPSSQ